MKFISWNVNGIRAWHKKGASEWMFNQNADFLCLQETKAHPEQLGNELINPKGYLSYFDHSKTRKGYSGVAIFVRKWNDEYRISNKKKEFSNFDIKDSDLPKVDYGLGIHDLDQEGRFLALHFKDFSIINCYFPNGGEDPKRLEYKLKFYEKFLEYIEKLKKKQKNIIFCGDVNTAHNEIDIARPKANENHTGFLRIERDWIDKVVKKGWIDTYRKLNPTEVTYTWWDMKTFARERNVGWRLDYFFVSPALENKIKSAKIHDEVLGSDHCPVELVIDSF